MYFKKLKTFFEGSGEMAPWLRALAALAEDPGVVPKSHMVAQSHP